VNFELKIIHVVTKKISIFDTKKLPQIYYKSDMKNYTSEKGSGLHARPWSAWTPSGSAPSMLQ